MENLKTVLAMIGLVAIGFGGGFFTHATLTRHHLEQVAREATIPGFEERLFHVIKADEEQRQALLPLVREYAERLGNLHQQVDQQRKMVLDSLHADLQPLLSADQQERLDRFAARQIRFRPPPDGKRPGPGRRPH